MRRGALITMAEAGAPISVLLNFSKHKSSAMLYRYLGWGWHCAAILPSGSAMDRRCLEQPIQFTSGKTVAMTGPYTVHTARPSNWPWHHPGPTPAPVFMTPEITQSLALAAIKAQDPALEARSMRRGALITMAEAGAPISVLLNFSKHKSSAMLYRYLGWGWHCAADRESGALAAQSLLSGLSD